MSQLSFSGVEYASKRKQTRCEKYSHSLGNFIYFL